MRARPTRPATAGSDAVLAVIVSGVAATSGPPSGDRRPSDRDVMAFSPACAEDEPVSEKLSDVVAIVAKDLGYDPLTVEDLDRIEVVSTAAIASASSVVDADLRDTDRVVDLHVSIHGSERTGYLAGGGSFRARVLSGDDQPASVRDNSDRLSRL